MSAAETKAVEDANETIPDWLRAEIELQKVLEHEQIEVPRWVAKEYPNDPKLVVKPSRRCCGF